MRLFLLSVFQNYLITMHEISTVKGMSIDTFQNAQLKRKYEKHMNKVMEITQKKSNVQQIFEEQRKISEILRKSKQISKSFKEKELMIKCEAQNRRLQKSLSTIHARPKIKIEREEEENHLRRRMKTYCKEGSLRQYQIERENRILAQNIMGNVLDAQKYRKKLGKEITQYERLKTQLQRLKPIHLGKISETVDLVTHTAKPKQKNGTGRHETQPSSQGSKTIRFHELKTIPK